MIADPCPPAQEVRDLALAVQPPEARGGPGYADALASTEKGPPVLPSWCVWLEPARGATPDRWERRWRQAVDAALATWGEVVPLVRVDDPDRAHVLLERRRPPLRQLAAGWRASNGRSLLKVVQVQRLDRWRLEPQVTVLVSPELRGPVLQATALHELGHAFGLWGHSSVAGDVMAVHQGREPLLQLSERDRLTLEWLRQQPTAFGQASPCCGSLGPRRDAWGHRDDPPAPAAPGAS